MPWPFIALGGGAVWLLASSFQVIADAHPVTQVITVAILTLAAIGAVRGGAE